MTDHPIRKLPPITATSTREDPRCDGLGCGLADDNPDHWDRTEAGDVTNGLAFRAHMVQVGEEDQSQPGRDGP